MGGSSSQFLHRRVGASPMPESTATRANHRRLSLGYETVNNESATRESSFPFAITMETRVTKSSIVSGIGGYRSHEVDTVSSSRGYTESRSEVNQRSSLRRETKTRSCKELNGGSLGTRILHYMTQRRIRSETAGVENSSPNFLYFVQL